VCSILNNNHIDITRLYNNAILFPDSLHSVSESNTLSAHSPLHNGLQLPNRDQFTVVLCSHKGFNRFCHRTNNHHANNILNSKFSLGLRVSMKPDLMRTRARLILFWSTFFFVRRHRRQHFDHIILLKLKFTRKVSSTASWLTNEFQHVLHKRNIEKHPWTLAYVSNTATLSFWGVQVKFINWIGVQRRSRRLFKS
jgi:hypothetical protein